MSGTEWVIALVVLVGILGTVVPVVPGAGLVLLGVLAWAVLEPTTTGWVVLAVSAALVVAGYVLSYLVPGRRLERAGVPRHSLFVAAAAGIVGFFVIPVLGLPIGFVGGLYLAERSRLGGQDAGRSTVLALKAVALNIAIELATAVTVAGIWLAAALSTPTGSGLVGGVGSRLGTGTG